MTKSNRPLERPFRALRTISRRLTLAAGWALLLLSFAIAFEVVSRRVLRMSLQGVDEYGGYLLAVCGTIGFSYALFERAHIRIDVLLRVLPLPLCAVADVVALLALIPRASSALDGCETAATRHRYLDLLHHLGLPSDHAELPGRRAPVTGGERKQRARRQHQRHDPSQRGGGGVLIASTK